MSDTRERAGAARGLRRACFLGLSLTAACSSGPVSGGSVDAGAPAGGAPQPVDSAASAASGSGGSASVPGQGLAGTPAAGGGAVDSTVGGTGGSQPAGDAGAPAAGAPTTGGKALLVTGTIPIVGTDVQFEEALAAHGLEVEVIQESLATAKSAEGKSVIMLSYGMSSAAFNAEAFVDVPVPIIVTEHLLLPRLKMASVHGYTEKMSKLTFTSDHELASGNKGDVEVYAVSQEFFFGSPSSAAVRIAHIVGQPQQVAFFAYERGAMMDGATAPAKRVQFFHASHSPEPVDKNLYLNATGLKLLDVTIGWCLK